NAASQQDHFGRKFAAVHRSLLRGLAPPVIYTDSKVGVDGTSAMGWYAAGSIPDVRHPDPSGTLHIARLTPQLDRGDSCRAERSSKEATMSRAKFSAKGLLLISGIGIAAAALPAPGFAAVQPSSDPSPPTTVVIRGSDPAAAEPSSAKDTPPTV